MRKKIFEGVGTAIITPFSDNKIDYKALECLLNKQIESNVDAIIVLGTTGEASTISLEEREQIISFVVDKCKGKSKVIVGCGSNNTETVIKYYQMSEKLGVDGALIVTPYYNKCTQDGVIEHYKRIAMSGELPIIVYNVPGRTGFNIQPKTYLEMSNIKNVVGIKEASGNISQILETFKIVGDKIAIYSGDDELNLIFQLLGGSGCISVLSNVVPKIVKTYLELIKNRQIEKAKQISFELLPLTRALFLEVNPIPVKAALNYLGLCKNELRLPLIKMSENEFVKLKKEIDVLWDKYDSV